LYNTILGSTTQPVVQLVVRTILPRYGLNYEPRLD
jgi:hypothetical protein